MRRLEVNKKEEQTRKRIRWNKTRGGSQWAEDKKEEYRVALEEKVEELEEAPSWKELERVVATTAEEICGRKPRSSDIASCLESMKPEVLRFRKFVADSCSKVQEPRGQPNEVEERERHKGVKKWARNQERNQKRMLIKDVCCEIEWSIQNYDMCVFCVLCFVLCVVCLVLCVVCCVLCVVSCRVWCVALCVVYVVYIVCVVCCALCVV